MQQFATGVVFIAALALTGFQVRRAGSESKRARARRTDLRGTRWGEHAAERRGRASRSVLRPDRDTRRNTANYGETDPHRDAAAGRSCSRRSSSPAALIAASCGGDDDDLIGCRTHRRPRAAEPTTDAAPSGGSRTTTAAGGAETTARGRASRRPAAKGRPDAKEIVDEFLQRPTSIESRHTDRRRDPDRPADLLHQLRRRRVRGRGRHGGRGRGDPRLGGHQAQHRRHTPVSAERLGAGRPGAARRRDVHRARRSPRSSTSPPQAAANGTSIAACCITDEPSEENGIIWTTSTPDRPASWARSSPPGW